MRKPSSKAKYMLKAANIDTASGNDNWTLQGIVSHILCFVECFCSEIALKLKKTHLFRLVFFLPESEASVTGLVDDEVVSVRDEASADEAAAKLKQYAFISVVSGYK